MTLRVCTLLNYSGSTIQFTYSAAAIISREAVTPRWCFARAALAVRVRSVAVVLNQPPAMRGNAGLARERGGAAVTRGFTMSCFHPHTDSGHFTRREVEQVNSS